MTGIIAGGILFVCFAYIGYGIERAYKKRYNFLNSFADYFASLENGISYLKSDLAELTHSYVAGAKGDCVVALQGFCALLDRGSYTKDDCESLIKTRLVTAYERHTIAEALFSLGKCDYDTQLAQLAKYRTMLSPMVQTAQTNCKKSGALAFKLGILAGLAALLLFV